MHEDHRLAPSVIDIGDRDTVDLDLPGLHGFLLDEREFWRSGIADLSNEDMMATLNQFSAATISEAIKKCAPVLNEIVIYTSGGGMHNPLLMQNIRAQLPRCIFKTTESLAINPDAKEAVLFAVLANETVAGGHVKIGRPGSGTPTISMGKISFPL